MDPNRIDFVFPKWRDSLLPTSHLFTLHSAKPSVCSMVCMCFQEIIMAAASAYNRSLHFTADFVMDVQEEQ